MNAHAHQHSRRRCPRRRSLYTCAHSHTNTNTVRLIVCCLAAHCCCTHTHYSLFELRYSLGRPHARSNVGWLVGWPSNLSFPSLPLARSVARCSAPATTTTTISPLHACACMCANCYTATQRPAPGIPVPE